MTLFQMTDAQLDRMVEAHYDRMYEAYYGNDDACCKYCQYFDGSICTRKENRLTDEEIEEMEANDDFSEIEVDEDDYCDDFEAEEPDYPEYDPYDF